MFKILSKNNFSVALTLILTILLSQSNIINVLFDTILGRTVLILIILGISYTNHQLGIVSTLFVIMIFACSYNYTENFETTSAVITPATTIAPATVQTTPLTAIAPASETDELDNKYFVSEGFDIMGTERNLQRGKKSNSIMVNEDMRKSENVDPYDGWNNLACFTSIS